MSHKNEGTIHGDIKVKFDKFNPKQVKIVNFIDVIDLNVVPKNYLKDNDAYVLYNLFTKNECKRIIEAAEKEGFDKLLTYDPSYRNNKRIICEANTIINELTDRIKHFVEKNIKIDEESRTIHKHRNIYGICKNK